ncbi:hypothetical protein BJ085DRAFT_40248 [Dimargaris cristalligena]|uniref:F-box domain-containing protein n=1 Tax=Dimargaris cristalligena TaxID=215637 RepID=A0A4P9ZL46_9FUNG|nr:hypothetical protein BJ085DRAFT_40248 [Dimargaris cristalligena]|eukprot:RKP33302.1 hypothetical protein BJ085DRAFT_40248 [Dimargaris cristalligena]
MKPTLTSSTLLGLALTHLAAGHPHPINDNHQTDGKIHSNAVEHQPSGQYKGSPSNTIFQRKNQMVTPSLNRAPLEIIHTIMDELETRDLVQMSKTNCYLKSVYDTYPGSEVFVKLANLADIPTGDLQAMYNSDPVIKNLGQSISLVWNGTAQGFYVTQVMMSVSAVLATTGQFGKLRELLDRPNDRSGVWLANTIYSRLLLLEFDDSNSDQDRELIAKFTTDCKYAGALGFKTAERKCGGRAQNDGVSANFLYSITAGGFVYPHRDSSNNPKLAIRVSHSAVINILNGKKRSTNKLPWLDHTILLDQLHLTNFRNSVLPPQPPNQE